MLQATIVLSVELKAGIMLQATIVLSVAHYGCTYALWSHGVEEIRLAYPCVVTLLNERTHQPCTVRS